MCCIELYDEAIRLDNNPVAYVSKSRNELFIADSIYDSGHRDYHYFTAATLLDELKPYAKYLEPEQRQPIEEGGRLNHFKNWFHENYNLVFSTTLKATNTSFILTSRSHI